MFSTLPESRAARTRRTGGAMVSFLVHAGVVGGLVAATANAAVRTPDDPQETPVQFTEIAPPPPPTPAAPASAQRVYTAAPAPAGPSLVDPIDIPSVLPPVDLSRAVTNAEDFARGVRGIAGGVPGGTGEAPAPVDGLWLAGQVDKPVVPVPGSSGPAYPEMLRAAGIEGLVLAQFVVDTTGRADLSSVQMLRSDHALFAASVKQALARMRFLPAEAGGRKVAQLVQQPFEFRVTK